MFHVRIVTQERIGHLLIVNVVSNKGWCEVKRQRKIRETERKRERERQRFNATQLLVSCPFAKIVLAKLAASKASPSFACIYIAESK